MARNTTGLPDTGDYALGRGIVYIASLDANDQPDDAGWRDVGNAPEFNINVTREELDHYSSRGGLRVKDKTITLQQDVSLTFQLDEINDQNLALFFSGETADHTNAAIVGASNVILTSSVVLGRWYDLVNSAGERLYDVDIANLTVEETTPTTLVSGTDFILDSEMGRIFIKSDAVNVSAGDAVRFTATADAGAKPVQEVRGQTEGNVVVAIKFVSENPANANEKEEYQFHKVTLGAEGDLGLISDEWQQMGFTGSVESATHVDAASPFFNKRSIVAA